MSGRMCPAPDEPHGLDVGNSTTNVRLSVVIPVFNMAATLRAAIDAALAELTPEDELIVVDDGSTDGSAAIAERYPVRLVRLPGNGGTALARHAGARVGRGRFVAFTDADAALLPMALEHLLAPLTAGEADVVVGVYAAEPFPHDVVSRFKNLWIRHTFLAAGQSIRFPFGCISAMRREEFIAATEAVDWDGELEDFALGAELQQRGARFRFEPRAEVRHARSFSLAELASNDFRRARSATRLALDRYGLGKLAREQRVANIGPEYGIGAVLGLCAVLAAAFGCGAASLTLALGYVMLNFRLYRSLWQQGGLSLAAAGPGLLALSQVAAMAGATWAVAVRVGESLRRSGV